MAAFNRTSMELKLERAGTEYFRQLTSFNRTSMELKLIQRLFPVQYAQAFNRTSMELKLRGFPGAIEADYPFNRTSMELKRDQSRRQCTSRSHF